jgi:carboxymethylenebutenolidase
VRETQETISTRDGEMPTFVFHPAQVAAPLPTVIWLMDGLSIRPALRDMASRLATAGYCVLQPYLFYRSGPYREFGAAPEDVELRRSFMQAMTPELAVRDVSALIEYAGALPASSDAPMGIVGYCMSGSWALAAAREFSGRVSAVASVHGGYLVTDGPDSPHRNLDGIDAQAYIAWADDDPSAPAEGIELMRRALADAAVDGEVELMSGAPHGFAPPGSDRYRRAASEKHWERLHALFRRLQK